MLDSVMETATEKGPHTIEYGLKIICFQVMRGDRAVLLIKIHLKSISMQLMKCFDVHKTQRKYHMCFIDVFLMI